MGQASARVLCTKHASVPEHDDASASGPSKTRIDFFNQDDRNALAAYGRPSRTRADRLEETQRRSLQLIWREEITGLKARAPEAQWRR